VEWDGEGMGECLVVDPKGHNEMGRNKAKIQDEE